MHSKLLPAAFFAALFTLLPANSYAGVSLWEGWKSVEASQLSGCSHADVSCASLSADFSAIDEFINNGPFVPECSIAVYLYWSGSSAFDREEYKERCDDYQHN